MPAVASGVRAKVLDFGLAKLVSERRRVAEAIGVSTEPTATAEELLTSPGSTVGTVAYMSPEQVRGEELDTRTDLFSLGVVLYEMATSQQAFSGSTSGVIFHAILERTPIPLRSLNPGIPAKVEEIINTALEKDRGLRCQTAAELRADLKRLKRDMDSPRSTASVAVPLQVGEAGQKPATESLQGAPARRRRAILQWLIPMGFLAVLAAGFLIGKYLGWTASAQFATSGGWPIADGTNCFHSVATFFRRWYNKLLRSLSPHFGDARVAMDQWLC